MIAASGTSNVFTRRTGRCSRRYVFSKAKIERALDQSGAFTLKYRLLEDGSLVDVRMKAKRIPAGGNQIIISISLM